MLATRCALAVAVLISLSLTPGSLALSEANGHGVRVSLSYGTAPSTLSVGMGGMVPMVVELWRYPAGGGAPTRVDSRMPGAYGQVFLKDAGLGSVKRSGAYIHYAVQAVRGNYIVGQYDWSPLIRTGYVESQVALAIDASRASYVDILCVPPPDYPGATSIGAPLGGCGACQNSWHEVFGPGYINPPWISQPTIVGEIHATSGMTSQFNYGQQSGTTISVYVAYAMDGWSVSGSLKYSNTLGWDVLWPGVTNIGLQTLSQFNYEEDVYQNDCTNAIHEYKVYATAYNGGALWGNAAGGDNACPLDVAAAKYGNWAGYVSGAQGAYTVSDTTTYEIGTMLSGVKGASTGELGISVSTSYETHTKSIFNIGSGHTIWLAYSETLSGWPKIYWTNDDVCRPPPSPAPSPSYPGDGGGGGGGGHPPAR